MSRACLSKLPVADPLDLMWLGRPWRGYFIPTIESTFVPPNVARDPTFPSLSIN
jgi:hypothetical protein